MHFEILLLLRTPVILYRSCTSLQEEKNEDLVEYCRTEDMYLMIEFLEHNNVERNESFRNRYKSRNWSILRALNMVSTCDLCCTQQIFLTALFQAILIRFNSELAQFHS